MQEVRGLARGSGVPFNHLMALNLEFELMSKGNVTSYGYVKGCSDYHIVRDNKVNGWGHNEDGNQQDSDLFYFVAANISSPLSSPLDIPSTSSSYFSFTYAGRLSGWAWSYNTKGLVFTVNGLYVLPNTALGLGINFIARDLLDATSLTDVVVRGNRPDQDGGSHFNVGDITQKLQLSIETGYAGTTVQKIDGVTNSAVWYAHFNQYLHTDLPHSGDYISSMYRMARATTLATRKSTEHQNLPFVLDVLGDQGGRTDNDVYCLHRCNNAADPYVTYVTVLIDLLTGVLKVYTNRTSGDNANRYWWKVDVAQHMLPTMLPNFPQ